MPKSSTYPSIKALIISAIVISLTACSSGTESSQSSSDSTTSSNSQTTEQTTEAPDSNSVATAPANSSVGEVPKPEEVKFQEFKEDVVAGYVDAVNDSTEFNQTIPKTQPIAIQGWAVSPKDKKPADMVIITLKDDQSIISTAAVDVQRQDVANELKEPSAATSGWYVQIDPATLPSENVVLQAWAYDSETKEAYPLSNTPEITRQ